MTVRVGINGFGRIGRQVMKIMMEKYPNDLANHGTPLQVRLKLRQV